MSLRTSLRTRIERRDALVVPGAYDCVSALLIEQSGFEAAYLTGYGLAASRLGLPDLGFTGLADVATQTQSLAGVLSVPLLVDADTGYGGTLQVRHTVRVLEACGAAAVQLEDQRMPKRCGHLAGHDLVSRQELGARIRAAVESRGDPDLLIVARTDAISAVGFDEALRRCEVALRAGADVLFVEAPIDEAQVRALATAFDAPLLYNLARGGRSPELSLDLLRELRYAIVLLPLDTLLVAARAVRNHLVALKRCDDLATGGPFLPFSEMNSILGLAGQLTLVEADDSPAS